MIERREFITVLGGAAVPFWPSIQTGRAPSTATPLLV